MIALSDFSCTNGLEVLGRLRCWTFLAVLCFVSFIACAALADDGPEVSYNTTWQNFNAPDGSCYNITNNSITGDAVYVPSSTNAEWQSFKNNPPNGVSISVCGQQAQSQNNSGGGSCANSGASCSGTVYIYPTHQTYAYIGTVAYSYGPIASGCTQELDNIGSFAGDAGAGSFHFSGLTLAHNGTGTYGAAVLLSCNNGTASIAGFGSNVCYNSGNQNACSCYGTYCVSSPSIYTAEAHIAQTYIGLNGAEAGQSQLCTYPGYNVSNCTCSNNYMEGVGLGCGLEIH